MMAICEGKTRRAVARRKVESASAVRGERRVAARVDLQLPAAGRAAARGWRARRGPARRSPRPRPRTPARWPSTASGRAVRALPRPPGPLPGPGAPAHGRRPEGRGRPHVNLRPARRRQVGS
jgi:hypothetical protein